ncbi:Ocs element-binding factor 1 [Spatholobus suberectus]|nr:Ocs element-binding factor 1 [Spatholobus suberectus]
MALIQHSVKSKYEGGNPQMDEIQHFVKFENEGRDPQMDKIERSMISEYEVGDPQMDEMKRKKKALNHEYARKSRMKKQKRLEDLTNEVNRLQSVNKMLVESIKAKKEMCVEIEVPNNILRAQIVELDDRLRFLNSIIEVAEEVSVLKTWLELIGWTKNW